MNFYKHYLGDYQRDTGHLSMMEHGAYRLMLDTHYATEKPLPKTHSVLFRLLRAFTIEEQSAVASILEQFWTETPKGYVNKRVQEEIEKTNNKINANRENGKRGGRPTQTHDKTQKETQPEPKSNLIQTPDTRHQTNTPHKPPKGGDPLFARFWEIYPRKVGKGAAERAWTKAAKADDGEHIVAALRSYKFPDEQQFIPHPSTWLNEKRWLDEPVDHRGDSEAKRIAEKWERKAAEERKAITPEYGPADPNNPAFDIPWSRA